MTPPPVHLGLDIAKLTLDPSPHSALQKARYDNTPSGHRQLLRDLAQIPGVHVVCEATGGYEHLLLQALHQAGIPVSRLNPRQVRDHARATGRLAKTDAIAAAVLADYGQRHQPAASPAPDPDQQRLATLVARRRELQDLLQRERNRAEHHHDPFILKTAKSLRARLEKDLSKLEAPRSQSTRPPAPNSTARSAAPPLSKALATPPPAPSWPSCPNSAPSNAAKPPPWPASPPTTTTAAPEGASATSPTAAPPPAPPSTWPPSSPPTTIPS